MPPGVQDSFFPEIQTCVATLRKRLICRGTRVRVTLGLPNISSPSYAAGMAIAYDRVGP